LDTGYNTNDVSGSTDRRNYFRRGVSPIGALAHTTEGRGALEWLQRGSAKAGRPASADFYIERSGQRYALIPKGQAAYHAGVSVAYLQGRRFANDAVSALLIGVELERAGEDYVTYEQYDSFAELLTLLSVDYSWRWPYTVLGHYSVARPLGRRSDPVNFDWGSFMGRLYAHSLQRHVGGL
jgi:N-acetyl-anhydromuramyl-L-alanine amidase AmpD